VPQKPATPKKPKNPWTRFWDDHHLKAFSPYCLDANGGFGYGGAIQGCLVFDGQGPSFAFTRADAKGLITGLGAGSSYMISSARRAEQLKGPFDYDSAAYGEGVSVGGTWTRGYDDDGNKIDVGNVGATVGGSLVPVSYYYGKSSTTVCRPVWGRLGLTLHCVG
jgi:hypothetical protein